MTRFNQYNQPSLVTEFQRTWLISLIGGAMLLTGSGILFWNEGRAVRRHDTIKIKSDEMSKIICR